MEKTGYESVYVKNALTNIGFELEKQKAIGEAERKLKAEGKEIYNIVEALPISLMGFRTQEIKIFWRIPGETVNQTAGGSSVTAPKVVERVSVTSDNFPSILDRIDLFLEDEKWDSAASYCEAALDYAPKSADVYLRYLLADLKVSRTENLAKCKESFTENEHYNKTLRFADQDLSDKLRNINIQIDERNENARLIGIYNSAVSAMNAANTESAFKAAAETFKTIPGFKNADSLAEQSLDKAEVCRKDAIYASAKAKMTGDKTDGYEAAIKEFGTISGWKDADEQIYACRRKIEEIKVKEEADRLERERQAEQKRIAAEKAAKKLKKIAAVVTPVVVACIAFVIVLTTVIIPNAKYNSALDLYNAGKYEEAITAFTALNGYKDSEAQIIRCETAIKDAKYDSALSLIEEGKYVDAYEALIDLNGYKDSAAKAEEIHRQYNIEKLKTSKAGDYVVLGSYEQDNNKANGKEDIEWLVLATEGDKALVISRYALDYQRYNETSSDVTWETCSLRKWLNSTFISDAFNSDEQNCIISSTVSADKNPTYGTDPGKDTTDKVFLLSIEEANKYFSSKDARICAPTDYAIAKGAYTNSGYTVDVDGRPTFWWWLRSPGSNSNYAALVNCDGYVNDYGSDVAVGVHGRYVDMDYAAVRPALWINHES